MSSSPRLPARFWIGLAVSAVFLVLAFRKVEWAEVRAAWGGASPAWMLAGTVLLVAAWLVAALRWKTILAPAPQVTVRDTFAFIAIGYLANTILPLRLGDLARATLIGRQRNVGISRALGSMALERAMDVLTLVVIILALALVMDIPSVVQAGIATMAGGAAVLLAGLITLSLHREKIVYLRRMLGWILPERLADRVATLADRFTRGLDVIKHPGRLALVALYSSGLWLLTGLATCVWLAAFNLDLPLRAGLFVLVVINLGSAIPSSPGYVGVYHFLAVLALSVWNVEKNPALAYAIGTHALNILANVVVGGYFLVREGISLKALSHADEAVHEPSAS